MKKRVLFFASNLCLSLFLSGVFLYSNSIEARPSARSGASRSGAGARGEGTRLNAGAGQSTFSKDDLTVLCGRYFDKCVATYQPKRRSFKDPECQKLMPQCFTRFGPSSTQCQDKVYNCLDGICQPRTQCSDKGRVKEMAVSCLERAGKYYPYACSVRSFKSVIAQIVSEASNQPAPQQTIVQNTISPEVQAQLDAQQLAIEEQQALFAEQQAMLEEAQAQKNSEPEDDYEEEEDNEPQSPEDEMWSAYVSCKELLKTSEGLLEGSTEYADCSPTINDIYTQTNEVRNFDLSGNNGFKGGGTKDINNNTVCSKPKRLKSLRYRLNQTLKSLKEVQECCYDINYKASRAKMNSDYTQMIRKKFNQMEISSVNSSISKLDIGKYIDNTGNTVYEKEENKTKTKMLGDVENAVFNTKLLFKMNEIVLEDIENMMSNVELKTSGNGEDACQGLSAGGGLDQCIFNKAQQYLNEIRDLDNNPSVLSAYIKKVNSLYSNSAYIISGDCDSIIAESSSLRGCLNALRSTASDYMRPSRQRY